MNRARFGSTIAAALALGLIGGGGAVGPAAASRAAAVATQLNGSNKAPATPPVATTAQMIIREMSGGFTRYAYGQPRIWNGIQKRGNRKGRSRFNYNR